MTSTPSSTATPSPTTTPTTAATTPAKMDHRLVNLVDPIGPLVPQAQASSTSSMALSTAKVTWVTNGRIPIGYDETHSAAPTAEQNSALAHDIGHVMQTFCTIRWKSWKTNYNWRTWTRTCSRTSITSSANVTSSGRMTCTIVSSSLMIRKSLSRRVVQRSWTTDKIVSGEESIDASRALLPAFFRHVDRVLHPPEDAGFHIVTETLEQTFGRKPRTYCRGIGNARRRESRASSSSQSKSQVTALTQEVTGLRSELASYKSQMSMLVEALSSSRICLPCFVAPSPSERFHTKQA
ncbi:hypothetical protein D8674_011507 [Pyrus ussuriensis x Pyrus communis]|uniref:Uncharacterized protein n=1 Tax=Pyrus ussuriensis x Pyrus communis TaxID=2448454 RepID=A0A5N5FYW6_9ROSA|nr:hypothetical protein D8674_011507 [Pyrus ussuriensis x Pyrus communis]